MNVNLSAFCWSKRNGFCFFFLNDLLLFFSLIFVSRFFFSAGGLCVVFVIHLYSYHIYHIIIQGKSTQIPQYLVDVGGWAGNGFQVVCTQPRRIAAITLAQRVAQEAGTPLGQGVGYAVRFDSHDTPSVTRIKYVTDGLLLREATLSDPLLSQYSVVMVRIVRVHGCGYRECLLMNE